MDRKGLNIDGLMLGMQQESVSQRLGQPIAQLQISESTSELIFLSAPSSRKLVLHFTFNEGLVHLMGGFIAAASEIGLISSGERTIEVQGRLGLPAHFVGSYLQGVLFYDVGQIRIGLHSLGGKINSIEMFYKGTSEANLAKCDCKLAANKVESASKFRQN